MSDPDRGGPAAVNISVIYPLPEHLGDAAFPEAEHRANRCAAAVRKALNEAARAIRALKADHLEDTATWNATCERAAMAVEILKTEPHVFS